MKFKEGFDRNRHTKGGSFHKFHYTYGDISDMTGYSPETLRVMVYRGKFDPRDIHSVFDFVTKVRARQS